VDWKPVRAVQAKVRDSKERTKSKKEHDYWSVPTRKYSGSIYKWWLLPDFGLMGFIPKKCLLHHQLIHHTGIYPDNGLIHLQWYYPQGRLMSVGAAMSVHLPSDLSNLISSSYIQSYKSYIHTLIYFIHSCIHNIYTTSFRHDCINHQESCLAISLLFVSHQHFKWQIPKTNSLKIYSISPGVILSVSGPEVSPIKHFEWQVLQTNNLQSFSFLKNAILGISVQGMSTFTKPNGFWRTFEKPVESEKPSIKARWVPVNLLSKPSGF